MVPYSRLFRSRWSALFWAAGMIWLAVDVAGVGGPRTKGDGAAATDVTGTSIDDADTRNAITALDSVN